MALTPFRPMLCDRYLWDDLWDDWPLSPFSRQWFGLDLDELREALDTKDVDNDQRKFCLRIDCSHFKPEEIKVVVKDRDVLIECNHEERSDAHGWVRRRFVRRYRLPEECEPEKVVSNLDPSGMLVVEAPKKAAIPLTDYNERIVPIEYKQENKSYIDAIKKWFKRSNKL